MSIIRQILSAMPRRQWLQTIVRGMGGNNDAEELESEPHGADLLDTADALADPKEKEAKLKLSTTTIEVPEQVNISPITGIPEKQIQTRRVRIFVPAKTFQSGTHNTKHWTIEFDNHGRWENPLMGWGSSGDPLGNLNVNFGTSEEAILYCEKMGWKWFLDGGERTKKERVKSYGQNFSWNKRTRLSTK